MIVLDMINTLDANSNVGEVSIKFDRTNYYNDEILKTMMNKYNNLYSIELQDDNDEIDHRKHNIIKQWIQ